MHPCLLRKGLADLACTCLAARAMVQGLKLNVERGALNCMMLPNSWHASRNEGARFNASAFRLSPTPSVYLVGHYARSHTHLVMFNAVVLFPA